MTIERSEKAARVLKVAQFAGLLLVIYGVLRLLMTPFPPLMPEGTARVFDWISWGTGVLWLIGGLMTSLQAKALRAVPPADYDDLFLHVRHVSAFSWKPKQVSIPLKHIKRVESPKPGTVEIHFLKDEKEHVQQVSGHEKDLEQFAEMLRTRRN